MGLFEETVTDPDDRKALGELIEAFLEICRELNVDRNYLRVLLHRAKAKFRDRFLESNEA